MSDSKGNDDYERELPLDAPGGVDRGGGGDASDVAGGRPRRHAVFEFGDDSGGDGDERPDEPRSDGVRDSAAESMGSATDRPAAPQADPAPTPSGRTRSGSEVEDLFERAKAESGVGRLDQAMQIYRKLVALEPGHLRGRNNLGVLLDQTGAHELALEQFQAAAEIDPENPEVLTNLGAALGALGRYDEAEAQLRRALRLDPNRVDVRANLGILFYRRGLYGQSELELRWVCEQDPQHSPAHFYRGEALNRLGRTDEALETLERASHLQPDNARIYYLLGILYDKKHLRPEAGEMYKKARSLSRQ